MAKGPKGEKRPADVVANAVSVMRIATGEAEEEHEGPRSVAAELGSKGGQARAAALSKDKRSAIAKAAAKKRWCPEGAGDVWTWTALDSDSKLIVSYLIGDRNTEYATAFMEDLHGRLATRVRLSTDGLKSYLAAVDRTFGPWIDYAMINKIYGNEAKRTPEARNSPGVCIGVKKETITGTPDADHISTSHVEGSNLSMRMHMRRYTRLTSAQQEVREPLPHGRALHRLLQFRTDQQRG